MKAYETYTTDDPNRSAIQHHRRAFMAERPKFTSIDQYVASAKPDVQNILQEIRHIIKSEVPTAVETISYQMPAFRLGKVFIYFAAFKEHIGIYPPVKGDKKLQGELLPYRGPKGNLKFPLDQPMPYQLIRRVAAALSQE